MPLAYAERYFILFIRWHTLLVRRRYGHWLPRAMAYLWLMRLHAILPRRHADIIAKKAKVDILFASCHFTTMIAAPARIDLSFSSEQGVTEGRLASACRKHDISGRALRPGGPGLQRTIRRGRARRQYRAPAAPGALGRRSACPSGHGTIRSHGARRCQATGFCFRLLAPFRPAEATMIREAGRETQASGARPS